MLSRVFSWFSSNDLFLHSLFIDKIKYRYMLILIWLLVFGRRVTETLHGLLVHFGEKSSIFARGRAILCKLTHKGTLLRRLISNLGIRRACLLLQMHMRNWNNMWNSHLQFDVWLFLLQFSSKVHLIKSFGECGFNYTSYALEKRFRWHLWATPIHRTSICTLSVVSPYHI